MIYKAIAPNGQIVEDKKHGQQRDYTHMTIWFCEGKNKWVSSLITTDEKKANKEADKLKKFLKNVAVVEIIK